MCKYLSFISISVLLVLAMVSCKGDDGGTVGGGGETIYELEVSMNPSDAGSVAPDGGEYEDGKQLNIEATPSGDWQFSNWSGDISSTENPVAITMDKDYEITANFSEPTKPEAFETEITITDGVYSEDITLISDNNGSASTELDQNDREGPPIAPPGTFFAGVVNNGMNLFKDVRPANDRLVWELRLNRASGRTMSLDNWTISKTLEGSLMLVDNPDDSTPDIEIDMQSDASYSISDPSIQRLYVVYEKPEPAKMITNVDDQRFDEMIDVKPDPSKEKSLKDKTGIGNKKNIKRNNR